MGEGKLAVKAVAAACQETINAAVQASDDSMRVQTPGGVFTVRWDDRGSATALGQLAFFAQYLETAGLFEAWLKSCSLNYTSPNAPALVDVLGTWMLSILDGHCRYAHVGALRGDGVAPSILGMGKIIGDDSLRRALSAIAPGPITNTAPSSAQHNRPCPRRAMDAGPTRAQHRAGHRYAVDTGLRHHHQRYCTDAKTVRWSATTRTSPGAPVTPCTPTGPATCAWC